MEIYFVVPGEVVGKGRPRFSTVNGYGRAYTPKKTLSYEKSVRNAYLEEYPTGLLTWQDKEPLEMIVNAYFEIPKSASKKAKQKMLLEQFPTKKPDADNIIKSIADALNGIVYTDDSQIVSATVHKIWSSEAKAEVIIREVSK